MSSKQGGRHIQLLDLNHPQIRLYAFETKYHVFPSLSASKLNRTIHQMALCSFHSTHRSSLSWLHSVKAFPKFTCFSESFQHFIFFWQPLFCFGTNEDVNIHLYIHSLASTAHEEMTSFICTVWLHVIFLAHLGPSGNCYMRKDQVLRMNQSS